MSEGERQALAVRLYDDWQETDTSNSLEIYCYQQGRADAFDDVMRLCDAYCHFDKSKHPSNGYVISRASLLDIVGKLKEQKNDK